MTSILPLLRTASIALLVTTAGALGHEGHDHAEEGKAPPVATLQPRLSAASGPFELVAIRQGSDLVISLDDFETNAPIGDASITVETPAGSVTAEARDGSYRIAAPWATPGSHSLIFAVTAGERAEVLSGTLTVPPDAAGPNAGGGWWIFTPALAQGVKDTLASGRAAIVALVGFVAGLLAAPLLRRSTRRLAALLLLVLLVAPGSVLAHEGHDHTGSEAPAKANGEVAQRLPDGALFVPKPVQRILAIRTVLTRASDHPRTIELPGRIIPDPNASGLVQAAVSGRLSPPAGGFPRLGTPVKAGDVLAYVTPPFQAIDVSDMRQKAGELEQQI